VMVRVSERTLIELETDVGRGRLSLSSSAASCLTRFRSQIRMKPARKVERFFATLVIISVCIIIGFWADFGSFQVVGTTRPDNRRLLHIAAIFPINGTGGWQGGQVRRLRNFPSLISNHSEGMILIKFQM